MEPMAGPTFPLRFRSEQIRALVREVAKCEGISQNELLEQAAEHEVIARGALLAQDLEASLDRLRSATNTDLAAAAAQRALPTLDDACGWHRRIYDGCAVPAAGYVGNFRGGNAHPELADYEVGIGAVLPDGLPEKVGVWAADVAGTLAGFI